MEHCKYCGCLGLFFGLNKNGLCATCQHMVSMEIGLRSQVVRDATKKVDTTHNPQSKIAGLDLVVENLAALRKYEERGIPTVEGSPSALLAEARRKQQELILETARAERKDLLAQVEKAEGFEAKRRVYAGFMLRIADYKTKLDDPAPLEELEAQIRRVSHQIQLNAAVDAALQAEQAGDKEAAVRRLHEAAEFLRKADVDERYRTSQMLKLNERIKKLGGRSSRPPTA